MRKEETGDGEEEEEEEGEKKSKRKTNLKREVEKNGEGEVSEKRRRRARKSLHPLPCAPLRTLSSRGLDPAAALVLEVFVNVGSLAILLAISLSFSTNRRPPSPAGWWVAGR